MSAKKDVRELPKPYRDMAELRIVKLCEQVDKLMIIAAEFECRSIDISTRSGYIVSIQEAETENGGT